MRPLGRPTTPAPRCTRAARGAALEASVRAGRAEAAGRLHQAMLTSKRGGEPASEREPGTGKACGRRAAGTKEVEGDAPGGNDSDQLGLGHRPAQRPASI